MPLSQRQSLKCQYKLKPHLLNITDCPFPIITEEQDFQRSYKYLDISLQIWHIAASVCILRCGICF